MSSNDLIVFMNNVGQKATLLALDVGQKTLGVAVGNLITFSSSAITTLKRTKFQKDMDALSVTLDDYDVTGVVIGLPLNMDGTEGRACQSIRDFAQEFSKRFPDLPILMWDERLSTDSVDGYLDESVDKSPRGQGISRRRAKESGLTDQMAAKIILDRVLEKIRQTDIS